MQVVAGRAAIKTMVTGFIAQHPHFTLQDAEVVQANDVALVRCRWMMTMGGSTGASVGTSVTPTLVVRRQPGGHWLVLIDRPLQAA
jgi:ketosteroid isomerase-like protein